MGMPIDKCCTCKHAFTTGKERLYCKKSLADKDDCGEYEREERHDMKEIKINFKDDVSGYGLHPYYRRLCDMLKNGERIYLDEQTMIVYIPLASAEFIEKFFGKIKEVTDDKI